MLCCAVWRPISRLPDRATAASMGRVRNTRLADCPPAESRIHTRPHNIMQIYSRRNGAISLRESWRTRKGGSEICPAFRCSGLNFHQAMPRIVSGIFENDKRTIRALYCRWNPRSAVQRNTRRKQTKCNPHTLARCGRQVHQISTRRCSMSLTCPHVRPLYMLPCVTLFCI